MASTIVAGGVPKLQFLDGFQLRHDGATIRVQPSVQRLLGFLALHDRPLQRSYVSGRLWTDSSQETANANLRTALWRLRHPRCQLVKATTSDVALADGVAVDIREATDRAERTLAGRPEPDDLQTLIRAGELLPDVYDDWIVIERERFRQLRLHALERLCELCRDAGRFAEAAAAGLAAIATDPLRESAHRVLISSYIAEGNLNEAARDYRLYRDLAHDRLGIEPSARLRDMVGPFAAVR